LNCYATADRKFVFLVVIFDLWYHYGQRVRFSGGYCERLYQYTTMDRKFIFLVVTFDFLGSFFYVVFFCERFCLQYTSTNRKYFLHPIYHYEQDVLFKMFLTGYAITNSKFVFLMVSVLEKNV